MSSESQDQDPLRYRVAQGKHMNESYTILPKLFETHKKN
jgi:hypothetical protein